MERRIAGFDHMVVLIGPLDSQADVRRSTEDHSQIIRPVAEQLEDAGIVFGGGDRKECVETLDLAIDLECRVSYNNPSITPQEIIMNREPTPEMDLVAQQSQLLALMEPIVLGTPIDILEDRGMMELAMISTAISMKRIADLPPQLLPVTFEASNVVVPSS